MIPKAVPAIPTSITWWSSVSFMADSNSLLISSEIGLCNSPSPDRSVLEKDQVVRVLDGNTIKLKKNGIVTLAGVRMPTPGSGNFQFPDCLSYTPAYKVRQLLPIDTNVMVKVVNPTSTGKSAQAVLVRRDDNILVNEELIRSGFGRVQKITNPDLQEYLDVDNLQRLQDLAKQDGIGIFKRCDIPESEKVVAQFEPLELTMETQWGDDGGKMVIRQKDTEEPSILQNPGDVKGTFEGKAMYFICDDLNSLSHGTVSYNNNKWLR